MPPKAVRLKQKTTASTAEPASKDDVNDKSTAAEDKSNEVQVVSGHAWLPDGWGTKSHVFPNGRKQTIFVNPDGKMFYQKADAMKHLGSSQAPPTKRARTSAAKTEAAAFAHTDADAKGDTSSVISDPMSVLDSFQLGTAASLVGSQAAQPANPRVAPKEDTRPAVSSFFQPKKVAPAAASATEPAVTKGSTSRATAEESEQSPKTPTSTEPCARTTGQSSTEKAPRHLALGKSQSVGTVKSSIPPAKRSFIDESILSMDKQKHFFKALDALDSLAFAR